MLEAIGDLALCLCAPEGRAQGRTVHNGHERVRAQGAAAGPEQGIRRGSAFAVFVGGDDIGAEPSALALPSLLLPRRSAFFCTLRPHRGA